MAMSGVSWLSTSPQSRLTFDKQTFSTQSIAKCRLVVEIPGLLRSISQYPTPHLDLAQGFTLSLGRTGIRSRLLECCYLGTYPIQRVSNHHIEAERFAASGPSDIASTAARPCHDL